MNPTIDEDLVDFYLQEFTIHWFEDHEDAPDDLNEYNELIQGGINGTTGSASIALLKR